MSSTLLERSRTSHEWIETYEKAIIEQLEKKPRTNKERVLQQHRIDNFLQEVVDQSKDLQKFYNDKDRIFREELQAMRGRDFFASFYHKLRETREYHMRFPNIQLQHAPPISDKMKVSVAFSGEELYGRFLDLHELYVQFCNLPFQQKLAKKTGEKLEYGQYLETFTGFASIPANQKNKVYAKYIENLWTYLEAFFKKTQPLVDFNSLLEEPRKDFKQRWNSHQIAGWKREDANNSSSSIDVTSKRPLNLQHFYSPADLEALGADRLKEALEALGMKCGGTLKQRAERLFSIKGKDTIPPKLLATGQVKTSKTLDKKAQQDCALKEFQISFLCEQMKDVVTNTIKQVEKKQTRTVEEREQEILEEEEGMLPGLEEEEEEEESDDEGPIYNPLNLPLGWDGKPIPYWLYKLHGLGVEYKCEICGNAVYMGRRAFDRHFQEWRHAHGMRCLGIPNTKHFHDITIIEDAKALYDKIKDQLDVEQWNGEIEEEYEDSEGNVLNRRTYEDLARQGLL